jgi:DNA adenine methylase
MSQQIKGVLRYPGGKTKVLSKLLPIIPDDFEEYREPFVGGGSVFISTKQQKNWHAKYRINDLNYELYCFWKQLRDNPVDLMKQISNVKQNCLDGKQLYYGIKCKNTDEKFEFEVAYEFYILNRITFSGLSHSGGFSKESFEKRFTWSSIERLKPLSNLIQDVQITNDHYKNLLLEKGENVFIFLDPPYFSAKDSKLYGQMGNLHSGFDHKTFAEDVKKCSHRWLITYDDSPEIRELFKFANIYEWEVQYGVNNGHIKKINGGKAKVGNELLISNYPL